MGWVYEREGTRKFYIAYEDENGRLVRRSAKTEIRGEAEKELQRVEAEVARKAQHRGDTLYTDAAVLYVQSSRKPKTLRNYRAALRVWDPFLRGKYLREITRDDVLKFIARRRTQVTDATIRLNLDYLAGLLTVNGILSHENPVQQVRSLKILKKARKITRFASPEEEERLYAACRYDLHRGMIMFAIETGLREQELLLLQPRQVLRRTRELHLFDDRTKDAAPRVVPLSERAVHALDLAGVDPAAALVFRRENGEPFKGIHGFWLDVRKRAGICDLRWHDLRHTFATRWLQDGGDIVALQHILGHESISTTMRYAHLVTGHLHVQMGKVEKARAERRAAHEAESVVEAGADSPEKPVVVRKSGRNTNIKSSTVHPSEDAADD